MITVKYNGAQFEVRHPLDLVDALGLLAEDAEIGAMECAEIWGGSAAAGAFWRDAAVVLEKAREEVRALWE